MKPGKPNGMHGKTVGIDLGTTFSAIAHVDEYGKPQIIPNSENERVTPSVILFDGASAVVGSVAMQSAVAEPEKIVDFVKREMGKSTAQFHREFGGVQYSAEQLSSLILRKLKADAEKYLQLPVTHAVITVPAYFNDAERTATIRAGQLANLNVLQVINEPTAAALAYGLDRLNTDQTAMVFDLGGGTFDVTIMRIENNHLRMVASSGDHRLGGKEWDDVILHWVVEEFERMHGENPLLDLQSYQDLQSRSNIAKIQLSSRERSTLVHSYNGRSIKLLLTRDEFEERSKHLIERCKAICEIVIKEAGLSWKDLDRILLTGGMTRMPSVRAMISTLAAGVPIDGGLSPDEAVAIGAAIQGTLTMLRYEEEMQGQAPGAETLSPQVREQFSDRRGDLISVSDVSTHTLGVVLWDLDRQEEYVFPMIRKATLLPAKTSHAFAVARANATTLKVRVVEGQSTVPAECTPLGVCQIALNGTVPKGAVVNVEYAYNSNQTLEVVVTAAGKQSRATIDRTIGMSGEELVKAAADLCRVSVE